ncbi:MAG: 16S rRNA (cytosine(1402)-N(4))-methyltransferase RsmH [Phycisphaerales bacterium]|nr:16S rRNA (cytosine(1402)-N(4))-methyltransferase RsmH [Phycisphaerales bacterium]
MTDGLGHVPVLPREVLGVLSPREGETYVDCTAGLGGHASLVAPLVGASGRIVLNDVDDGNLGKAAEAVRRTGGEHCPEIVTIRGNFAELPRTLGERGIRADMALADLGFSSNQVDDPARGLSFRLDGPLDMRLDPGLKLSAADLVNGLPEAELARILRDYGEERHAGLVARKLVQARKETPILTTARLAEVVRSVLSGRSGPSPIDPATRSFQGLRIAVNDELGSLQALLAAILRGAGAPGSWLSAGARVAIISFHSLEDRLVKRALEETASRGVGEVLTRSPAMADEPEQRTNPRSRSAKLRAVRIGGALGT